MYMCILMPSKQLATPVDSIQDNSLKIMCWSLIGSKFICTIMCVILLKAMLHLFVYHSYFTKMCIHCKFKLHVTFCVDIIFFTVSKIKVTVPANVCAGREERMKVMVENEELGQFLKAKLTNERKGSSHPLAIKHGEESGTYLLPVQPKEEGNHLLSFTVGGQHVPNSPFLLLVNNRDFYHTTFEQLVSTMEMRRPNFVAFSSNGDMLVSSWSSNSVHVYDANGHKKTKIGKRGHGDLEFADPLGITTSGDEVFVVDRCNHRIQKISFQGHFIAKFGTKGSGNGQLLTPHGLAIGHDGMLYVSDGDNKRVVVFSDSGIFHRNIDISPHVQRPWGLAISPVGNLHVAGRGSHNYAVFTLDGTRVSKQTLNIAPML